MGVGFRDVVFLARGRGGTGIMGAGLLRPSASRPAQPSKPPAVRSETCERSSTRWTLRFAIAGPSKSSSPAAPAPELAVDATAGPGALRLGPVAGRDPPLRGQAEGGADRSLARRLAQPTVAAPTTWPSGSPAPMSAPRTGRFFCTAAADSSPG